MHFWCTNFGSSRNHSAHVMLRGDETDKEQSDCEERRREDKQSESVRNTSFNCSSADPHSSNDPEVGADLRMLADDGRDFRIGNTVLSPYCCVGLIIFAFLFILIGSVLTYAISRHSDAEVLQFLNKHNYLKAVSPLMICSGIIMLLLGITFWVVKRCRSRRPPSSTNNMSNSYFPPEGLAPRRSLQDSLPSALRGRNSLTSAISSRAVSPLLPPSSAGRIDNVEWKWPTQPMTAPPLGSFPREPSNDSSPVQEEDDSKEKVVDVQNSLTTHIEYSIPDVKVIPVASGHDTS